MPTAPGIGGTVGTAVSMGLAPLCAVVGSVVGIFVSFDVVIWQTADTGEVVQCRALAPTAAVTSRPQAFCVGWLGLSYGDDNLPARVPRFEITNRVGDFA